MKPRIFKAGNGMWCAMWPFRVVIENRRTGERRYAPNLATNTNFCDTWQDAVSILKYHYREKDVVYSQNP